MKVPQTGVSIITNTIEHFRTSLIFTYNFCSFFFYRVKVSRYPKGREKSMMEMTE